MIETSASRIESVSRQPTDQLEGDDAVRTGETDGRFSDEKSAESASPGTAGERAADHDEHSTDAMVRERESVSVGILLDEPSMERWAADAVDEAIRSASVSVTQVILPDDAKYGSTPPLKRYASSAIDEGAWAPVTGLHRLVNPPSYLRKVPIEDLEWFDDADVVRARTEPADGVGQRLVPEVIERLESQNLDLLFRRGFGILKGKVLTTPTHGVVSYHHGDIRRYRGRPPAVWEFANDERYAGVTLQRLTPTLDGGEILVEKRIEIGDLRTWQAIQRRLFERSTDMLATACTRLEDPAFEPTTVDELGPLYTCPGAFDTARIEFKNLRGRLMDRTGQ